MVNNITEEKSFLLVCLYRIIIVLLVGCILGIMYVSYTESYRISHAVISSFTETLRYYFLCTALMSFAFISFSSLLAFFEQRAASNFFLLISELLAVILEFLTGIVMLVVVFRLKGDDVGQQLWDLCVSWLGF